MDLKKYVELQENFQKNIVEVKENVTEPIVEIKLEETVETIVPEKKNNQEERKEDCRRSRNSIRN